MTKKSNVIVDPQTARLEAELASRVLCRRRLLPFVQRINPRYMAGWVHEDVCQRLEQFSADVVAMKSPRLMLLMPPRHGKLMADDTPVRTTKGVKFHGELEVGDKVYGSAGKPIKVLAVAPKDTADMKVTLSSGEVFYCHQEHEWTIFNARQRRWETRTAEWLAYQLFLRHQENCDISNRFSYHYRVPVNDEKFATPFLHNQNVRDYLRGPGIVAVECLPAGKIGNCIQVDAPDGLYEVGRNNVLTHNSELASRSFPAWHLGRVPDHEIIACSYNVSLAMSFSRKVKEIIESPDYEAVFDSRLNPNNQGAEEWSLDGHAGGYVAAGVGGGITGKGAHVLLIDDPIKNAEEADSGDIREKLWDWYGSTAYTRLAPGGGVLVIQCMTGDTPVRMPDGSERRLDSLRTGDEIATYSYGALSSATVRGLVSNGRDKTYRITTRSGKVVRANGRHPFLADHKGDLKWVRTQALTTANRIVAVQVSGVSGKASLVPPTAVTSLPSAVDCAADTTTSRSGPTGTGRPASTRPLTASATSSTATGSTSPSIGAFTTPSADAVQYAGSTALTLQPIGKTDCASTTITTQELCGGSYATHVTSQSDILDLSPQHVPLLNTSDFILDPVVSVEPDGEEEVFDLSVEGTENFIANGLVSHNTWWHDDDLAGRLQAAMANDPEADQFTVVKYPAIAEADEYYDDTTGLIVDYKPEAGRLLRLRGEPLHPQRYDLQKLNRIKKTIPARFWSALYQQNPVPDEGVYFTKEQFRGGASPVQTGKRAFMAWDFAISEKKHNDWTVGVCGLQDSDDVVHVVDVVRFRSADVTVIVGAIMAMAERWGGAAVQAGFEDGQIFRAIEPVLQRAMKSKRLYFPTTTLKPFTDKMARARPLQARMQQGMVRFDTSAPWYEALRTELLRFPAGVHDDQVDGIAWLIQLINSMAPPVEAAQKKRPSWRDKLKVLNNSGSHMAA